MTNDQDQSTSSSRQKLSQAISKLLQPVVAIFDRLIPPYEPRIEIEKKLVQREKVQEHAIVRHFSEIQLIGGFLLFILGFVLRAFVDSGYIYFISILGIVLVVSAYEVEEIYVTSHRIMIRRVGMIERIIRVPSDEEHATAHLVSFQVGRAPVNTPLVLTSGIGFLVIFNQQMTDFYQLLVIAASALIFILGLRINRRAVTLHLAGGLSVIMGIRKGVPKKIVSAIQMAIYEDQPLLTQTEEVQKTEEEQPGKDLSDQTTISDQTESIDPKEYSADEEPAK